MSKKVNITIGRFQPFTKGHLNMIIEGELPCIIYRINSSKADSDMSKLKVKGKVVKKNNIEAVVNYFNNGGEGNLNDTEKELLKRPFTNELIESEFDILKKHYRKNFIDIIYVKNAYEALADFAQKVSDGLYEPNYLMCGDDRVENYTKMINDTSSWKTETTEIDNVLKGKLIPNIGKGRTTGISGTDVRKSIITKDKSKFSQIMPNGVESMFDDFVEAFENFINILSKQISESRKLSLKDFIIEYLSKEDSNHLYHFISESLYNNTFVMEGGAGGHMSHPYDYTELTGEELLDLVQSLFSGKIENVKEKLDGTNIHATMNNNGQVVFIRNKSNLNSELGGMSIQDMADKWADKPSVQNTFLTAGNIITEIFEKLGSKYFNPSADVRKVINCECIIAGKTNVMPYAEDRVAFHGYKIYKFNGSTWEIEDEVEGHVDDIYKVAEGISAAKPRKNLVIKSIESAAKFAKSFEKSINSLFSKEGLTLKNTIEDWKKARFEKIKPEWLDKEVDKVFNRWFNEDKSFKATELKKLYPEHYDEVKSDKFAKSFVKEVMEPIDDLFLEIGNAFINMCEGFTNDENHHDIINIIKNDIEDVCDEIEKSGTDETKQQLGFQLGRLRKLGDDALNSAEGVVFEYKGKLMKLTGSFAAVNQILGTIKFSR